jgi:hypothetical protein
MLDLDPDPGGQNNPQKSKKEKFSSAGISVGGRLKRKMKVL